MVICILTFYMFEREKRTMCTVKVYHKSISSEYVIRLLVKYVIRLLVEYVIRLLVEYVIKLLVKYFIRLPDRVCHQISS